MQSGSINKIILLIIFILTIGIVFYIARNASDDTGLADVMKNASSTLSGLVKSMSGSDAISAGSINGQRIAIKTPKGNITAEVASTSEQLEKGLSGRTSLDDDAGMLFVFEEEGEYGFWMQDMNFPIDIIWMDASKTIIGVENSVDPSTYPDIFYPPSSVKYVLEINSAKSEQYGIEIGAKIVF